MQHLYLRNLLLIASTSKGQNIRTDRSRLKKSFPTKRTVTFLFIKAIHFFDLNNIDMHVFSPMPIHASGSRYG